MIKDIMEEWKELIPPKDLIPRLQVPTLAGNKANAIYGLRRVGKTYLSFQLAKNLGEVVYINLEDERIPRKSETLTKLLPAASSLASGDFWLIVDEVQTIPEWERWVNRVVESKQVRLIITGSTQALSKEHLPRAVRGRVKSFRLFPFTFREFLKLKKVPEGKTQIKQGKILSALEEYLKYGGMPTIITESTPLAKKQGAEELFDTIFLRDIIDQFEVSNPSAMKDIVKIAAHSKEITISKMYRNLIGIGHKIGKATTAEYIEYPQKIFLYELMGIMGKNIKDELQYPRKVYFADNIFYTLFSTRLNETWLLENMVYWELRRRHSGKEIRYWRSPEGYEVDFVVKEGARVRQLIQVAYSLDEEKTRKREERALVKASRELGCNNLMILTWDEEQEVERDGKRIVYRPVWRWLLEEYNPANR